MLFYIQLTSLFVKTVHLYSAGAESKMDYHMSIMFAYMASGEGGRGLEVLKSLSEGSEIFLLALSVCVWGGGGGVRFSTSSSVKNNRPPPINK